MAGPRSNPPSPPETGIFVMDETSLQRAYYARTASRYDRDHLSLTEPEHDFALAILIGIGQAQRFASFLDVGSGTGRGMINLRKYFPEATIMGIEPVEELRKQAYEKGVPATDFLAGDAAELKFPDQHFDCVLALGIMHHLPRPRIAIAEMARVARRAIFISDMNNLGCGPTWQRIFAHTLTSLRLWTSFQFLKNGFKLWKYNEGDGVHYSYSLMNDLSFIRGLGFEVFLFTTKPTEKNPLWDCSHVAILGTKPDSGLNKERPVSM